VYRASDQTAFRGPACAEEVAINWDTQDHRWRSQAGEIAYEDHPRSLAAPRILWRGSPPPARSSCGSSAAMMVGASPGIYNEPPSRFVRQVDDAEVRRRTLRGESQHKIAAALGVSRAQVCSARRRIKQAHGTSFSHHTGSKTSKYE
jgi:anti-sigma factor RsiW